MNNIALNLEPSQFLHGWRPDVGGLFLPALSGARVGEQVVARIGLFGHPVRATVYGKVAMVRRIGRPSLPPGVELQLERASVPAARYLALVASGEPVAFQVRAARYAVERSLLVTAGRARVEARTLTVSEGGCCIAWPGGDPPTPGEALALRMGSGLLAPAADAVVCWTSNGEPEKVVGVRVVPDGRGGRAWRVLVADVSRSPVRTV
jgi:hypothetical protein